MDLTFQVPMQGFSLQHWTLLSSPDTSTTGSCFHFGSASSFLLELFLHYSPVTCWALPTWKINLSMSYLFVFSYCSWGSQGKNADVVCLFFFSPVAHILSELSTMTRPSWVTLHGMAHSFTELDKAVIHVISLIPIM